MVFGVIKIGIENMNIEKNKIDIIIKKYLVDCDTFAGKLIDIFLIFLNLVLCVFFVLETYFPFGVVKDILFNIEVVIILVFAVEYLLRVYQAPLKFRFFFSIYGIIDLISIIPTLMLLLFPVSSLNLAFIKILRLVKVLRIFRFLRFAADENSFFGNQAISILKTVRLLLTMGIIFFVGSALFWSMESAVNEKVDTFGDALYFTVVALTTVGFGDIVPVSEAGRWVTVLMIFSGIIFIPWQAGLIIKEWLNISQKSISICPGCGLKYHDKDASHCKSCGHLIFQEYDGE